MAIVCKYDKQNKFLSTFNTETGKYMRTGILSLDSINDDPATMSFAQLIKTDTNVDPFMTAFPELIDVGIMGHCVHGSSGLCKKSGVQCYQNGLHTHQPNMGLVNFKRIADECKGKTYQFALGGRGDVDQHENFEEILKYCRESNIVPNFTSSGFGFTKEIVDICKKYCGAVAISWYRQQHTLDAIQMLTDAGVKTNIHYVLGKNSIDEAIEHLKNNSFPKGINAIIFLLHKPVGLGQQSNVLDITDPRVSEFFKRIDGYETDFKIGFDSCSVPGILNYTENIAPESIDTCEGGRWSCYITSDMIMLPCSFDNQDLRWAYDISNDTIENAWNSSLFESFREHFRNSCSGCKNQNECRGGCPIRREIVLCERKEKDVR